LGELADRRVQTNERLKTLQEILKPAEKISADKACVYATGSFGRGEASAHSDLDLFIVGKRNGRPGPDGKEGSVLKRLDEILLKAELIAATRELGIPEFSGDGRYLVHYSVHDFTKTLGTPEDDVANTFTARLLLLLESCPLVESVVYGEVLDEVIAAYWRDYEDHKEAFLPAFLANDILRLWRTFCVNYEARTERVPEQEKAKGKIKNYKLKHSRLLTCYSGLLYLLALFGKKGSVAPTDALDMIKITPTRRLERLRDDRDLAAAKPTIVRLLDQYERFLEATNAAEKDLIERFMDRKLSHEYLNAAYQFGDLVFEALNRIGNGNRFHRLLVV
jgi:predicted nucleotidyltransferase